MSPRRRVLVPLVLFCLAYVGLTLSAQAASEHEAGQFKEEFHHTYALPADGRVEVKNINGPVKIEGWDRNEVKVDAIKWANSKERLDEAKIVVEEGSSSVSIHTQYPDHDLNFHDGDQDNPATVEYSVMVPKSARVDRVELVNGSLSLQGLIGTVEASCVNGEITARGLVGRTHLSTVNSEVDAQFEKPNATSIELSSVNGRVRLTLPATAKAEVEANTVIGSIHNDFGLQVNNHRFVGHDLHGQLGGGGTQIHLKNVNGQIDIHRSGSAKDQPPVKDFNSQKEDQEDTI